jgi:hypothetical protein
MHTALAAAGVFLVAVSPIIVIGAIMRAIAWLRSGRGRHRAGPGGPTHPSPGES